MRAALKNFMIVMGLAFMFTHAYGETKAEIVEDMNAGETVVAATNESSFSVPPVRSEEMPAAGMQFPVQSEEMPAAGMQFPVARTIGG
ncbi:MAG TPA: hypothetical protein VLL97_02485, partial [Acidobacteriota bacterium]|nr:hypothetical protein [Acidobacteriota bacterium]